MDSIKKTLRSLTHSPGVYLFSDRRGHILYVGKAIDLSRRVKSYFRRTGGEPKTNLLMSHVSGIKTIETLNEFDALLLEAMLIRKHHPKYNVIAKDDKSPLYIRIPYDDPLPIVSFARKEKLLPKTREKDYFGPFQSSRVARTILRSLRRAIPFCMQKHSAKRPCFASHLGLCAPCPSSFTYLGVNEKTARLSRLYRTNVRRLRKILSGGSSQVLRDMERLMKHAAHKGRFEEAAAFRDQLNALRALISGRIAPHLYLENLGLVEELRRHSLDALRMVLLPSYPTLQGLTRIECIDISNLKGTDATGSLVVLHEGSPDTGSYRKFRIRRAQVPDDPGMMAEVVERRFRHPEWPHPDLLVVDGGKGQVNVGTEVLKKLGLSIPIIGLAKRNEEIIVPEGIGFRTIKLSYTNPALHTIQRIRDEAHRFALSYHRFLRQKRISGGGLTGSS
ncbi:MAG: UvrB/UvrC motif-containing protein [bacterium]|nr:UvrB/UvrC motif-containing protein [bacterium]